MEIVGLAHGHRIVNATIRCYMTPVSHHAHQTKATAPVRCFVLTVSDTRTEETDTSGKLARERLAAAGHTLTGYRIVKDEPAEVAELVQAIGRERLADAVILSGGTGISRRDSTYEAIAGLLDKRLDGFGELFRMLSHQQVGSAAMLSRAIGGVVGQTVVFALPGSTAAVELGLSQLIIPELGHLVGELSK